MSFTARWTGALLLAIATIVAAACERGVNHPVAPSTAGSQAASPGNENAQANIDICHRTSGAPAFVPMSVAAAAVEAHIAHGDAPVGHPVPDQPGMKFAADCTPVALVRTVIAFRDLTTHGAPVATYTESGLTLVTTAAAWQTSTTYGNPAPFIQFIRPASAPAVVGEVRITAGGAAFTFSSVDIYSSVTPIPFRITGLLNSTTVFTLERTQPNTFGNFATITNPLSSAAIDTLVIQLSNPATPCCANPVGLDNIVVAR
jgi:hypothetical protein